MLAAWPNYRVAVAFLQIYRYEIYWYISFPAIRKWLMVIIMSASPPTHQPTPKPQAELLIFGEVLYDCFPDGKRVLGGAPFNVAWSLQAFGQSPWFISAVGADADGHQITARMKDWGFRMDGLQHHDKLATGTVEVTLKANEPSYEICAPRAWDAIEDAGQSASFLSYHGMLALRSVTNRETLQAIMARSACQRFCDVNLRPPHTPPSLVEAWLPNADWAKLNLDELRDIVGDASVTFAQCDAAIAALRARYHVGTVLLTAGMEGARISGDYGEATLAPAPEADVFQDAVGAGDAFTAVTLYGIREGWPAQQMVEQAGAFAARVCGINGGTTFDKNFYQLPL